MSKVIASIFSQGLLVLPRAAPNHLRLRTRQIDAHREGRTTAAACPAHIHDASCKALAKDLNIFSTRVVEAFAPTRSEAKVAAAEGTFPLLVASYHEIAAQLRQADATRRGQCTRVSPGKQGPQTLPQGLRCWAI